MPPWYPSGCEFYASLAKCCLSVNWSHVRQAVRDARLENIFHPGATCRTIARDENKPTMETAGWMNLSVQSFEWIWWKRTWCVKVEVGYFWIRSNLVLWSIKFLDYRSHLRTLHIVLICISLAPRKRGLWCYNHKPRFLDAYWWSTWWPSNPLYKIAHCQN